MRKIVILLIPAMFLITGVGNKSLAAGKKQPVPTTQPQTKEERPVWVTVGSVNIRSGPSTQSKVIAGAKWNDKLLVIEEQEEWYKVQLPGGETGWVHRSLCSSKPLYPGTGSQKKTGSQPKPTTRSYQRDTSPSSHSFSSGSEAILRTNSAGFRTKQALKQLIAAPSADFEDTLRDLMFSGQALPVLTDTRVRILDIGLFYIQVRILEGPHQGEVVWVAREWLK